MSRREAMPGWGKRIERVRIRLKKSRAAFARLCGVAATTVRGWEQGDAGTTALTLKRGLNALGVPDVDRTLSWLADGGGEPPYWLDDGEPGSPLPPSRPDGMVAMPQKVLAVGREAFRILDGARAAGALRDPTALRAWGVLESEGAFAGATAAHASQGSVCSATGLRIALVGSALRAG